MAGRTVSLSLDDRGQTAQDFAVGIGIFLLAVAFVFSYVPTALVPFTPDVGAAEDAQADRLAATVLEGLTDERMNHLTEPIESYADGELGVRTVDSVNVTLQSLNGSTTYASAGDEYDGGASASASRIVTVDGEELDLEDGECEPACRLVVRVW